MRDWIPTLFGSNVTEWASWTTQEECKIFNVTIIKNINPIYLIICLGIGLGLGYLIRKELETQK